jgi:Family of unknown function (DUF5923)
MVKIVYELVDSTVRHLRTIQSLILTNSEVRKLLSHFSLIGRDIVAHGTSKAAKSLVQIQEL